MASETDLTMVLKTKLGANGDEAYQQLSSRQKALAAAEKERQKEEDKTGKIKEDFYRLQEDSIKKVAKTEKTAVEEIRRTEKDRFEESKKSLLESHAIRERLYKDEDLLRAGVFKRQMDDEEKYQAKLKARLEAFKEDQRMKADLAKIPASEGGTKGAPVGGELLGMIPGVGGLVQGALSSAGLSATAAVAGLVAALKGLDRAATSIADREGVLHNLIGLGVREFRPRNRFGGEDVESRDVYERRLLDSVPGGKYFGMSSPTTNAIVGGLFGGLGGAIFGSTLGSTDEHGLSAYQRSQLRESNLANTQEGLQARNAGYGLGLEQEAAQRQAQQRILGGEVQRDYGEYTTRRPVYELERGAYGREMEERAKAGRTPGYAIGAEQQDIALRIGMETTLKRQQLEAQRELDGLGKQEALLKKQMPDIDTKVAAAERERINTQASIADAAKNTDTPRLELQYKLEADIARESMAKTAQMKMQNDLQAVQEKQSETLLRSSREQLETKKQTIETLRSIVKSEQDEGRARTTSFGLLSEPEKAAKLRMSERWKGIREGTTKANMADIAYAQQNSEFGTALGQYGLQQGQADPRMKQIAENLGGISVAGAPGVRAQKAEAELAKIGKDVDEQLRRNEAAIRSVFSDKVIPSIERITKMIEALIDLRIKELLSQRQRAGLAAGQQQS